MPIRDEAINVFMGLPGDGAAPRADLQLRRRLLRARHRLQPHRDHRRRPRRDARAARRAGHRAREAAVHRARGRLAPLLRARSGRLPDRAHRTWRLSGDCAGLAVVDLGSNSFRLVVFSHARAAGRVGGWWKRTDEIYEAVRIGEGLDETGALGEDGMARASATIEVFAHFCHAAGLARRRGRRRRDERDPRRDATPRTFLERAREASGLRDPRALARGGGALRLPRRGQLDDLRDGAVLDLGGGSLQLVARRATGRARPGLLAPGRGAR